VKLNETMSTENGWNLNIEKIDQSKMITYGSNLLCGNGYLGYRGTLLEGRKEDYVACIVTDTYDRADGKWRELANLPNGLFTEVKVGQKVLNGIKDGATTLSFNFENGVMQRKTDYKLQGGILKITSSRFASFKQLNTLVASYQIKTDHNLTLKLRLGIDGEVWNLNGEHLAKTTFNNESDTLYCQAITTESKLEIAVASGYNLDGGIIRDKSFIRKDKELYLDITLQLEAGEKCIVERIMTVNSANDCEKPLKNVQKSIEFALDKGYQSLLAAHNLVWQRIWSKSDIKIKGNLEDQLALRFNLYHNIIATPAHSERLPIGARGLSCQAYQGSAFWDQEIFNLPMFLYTRPEIARNILKYRYHTLAGARKKATNLGYRGAFFAWISGKTGEELCPAYFFRDVISGRKIHNHFNDWQIHVSPDIAYAVWNYYLATDDWEFILNFGAELIFEIARFLSAHSYYKKDKDRFEFIRLLGPDEYHENVDNNAFTNYQAQFAMEKALYIYYRLKEDAPDIFKKIKDKINLKVFEITNWQEMAEKIYLPEPAEDSKLIEQFTGYFSLEDTTPNVLESRLIDKNEYWGWPNGVAVETQVIKQADLIQLFCLHDIFPKEVLEANYDYYEPRTQHGSSLSPSQYAIIACKLGNIKEAYQYFKKSVLIDIYNTNKAVSGGTFIGGIHTAAAGAAWQVVVKGFAGFRLRKNGISFSPNLPEMWQELSFNIVYQNNHLNIIINQEELKIRAIEIYNKVEIEVNKRCYQISGVDKVLKIKY